MRDILLITAITLNLIAIPLAIYIVITQRKLEKELKRIKK